jgi:AcrR family transcriptional regulator
MRPRKTAGRRPKAGGEGKGTRPAILAAARKVFARRGFDRTSIRDIADSARVNTAMIYYHFQDKADLFRSILDVSFAELEKIWDDEIFHRPASAREKLAVYIDKFIRFEHESEDLRRIFLTDFRVFSEHAKWTADRFFSESYKRLVRILKDGMKTGELRSFDPSLAVMTLIGMIVHTFMFRPISEHVTGKKLDLSPSRFGSFVTGMVFDGLAPHAGPTRPGTVRGRRVP